MSIYTADIILFLLLVSVFNNPFMTIFTAIGWSFIFGETVVGVFALLIVVLVHKFFFNKFLK